MSNTILCHMGSPRTGKPSSLREYGILRESIIRKGWIPVSEREFIRRVTEEGSPFHQCLFNYKDLMELGQERLCWRLQQFVGLDFDKCEDPVSTMSALFESKGMKPWLAYHTFSHNPALGHSYRLLWKTETDLGLSYEKCFKALKTLRDMTHGKADKHACNPTRLWQGTRSGAVFYNPSAKPLDLRRIAS